ncbi:MAG TPA: beta-ketoacyl synthase N-terminal-like domain-containing protein, partial [Metabacillus sp.]|nr:beta-ketoacyl synthase N-terminal-like domain-containing protein [Metabacillus sp.]
MSKIVVTGQGIKAPKTGNVDEFLQNLINGTCCLELVKDLNHKNKSTIAGIVDSNILELDNNKLLKRLPRTALLGIGAGKEAITYANLGNSDDKKIGVFFGISVGNTGDQNFQQGIINSNLDNERDIPITFAHLGNYHSITSSISYFLGGNDITKTISTGCTSSLEAIQDAMLYLKSGLIDIAIVGGVDSPISKAAFYSFAKTRVLPVNQSLEEGAIPFQWSSKGFAMSEAAGVIVLEREEDALARDVRILGEIDKVISNNDGVHIYSLDTKGDQMIKALSEAIGTRRPDYVNSQALGIQINDMIEKKASDVLFNHTVPYTSIKSMIGNPFGAIGIIQVISSLLSVQHGF